jgi:ArsR family transcriptional regulator
MRALPFESHRFDTVALHHVLHFVDDPAAGIKEAARMVAPGGKLLIVDYASHTREDFRARFQHLRLGFDDAAILGWMAASGLQPAVVSRHGGSELTVTLWEGRRA